MQTSAISLGKAIDWKQPITALKCLKLKIVSIAPFHILGGIFFKIYQTAFFQNMPRILCHLCTRTPPKGKVINTICSSFQVLNKRPCLLFGWKRNRAFGHTSEINRYCPFSLPLRLDLKTVGR